MEALLLSRHFGSRDGRGLQTAKSAQHPSKQVQITGIPEQGRLLARRERYSVTLLRQHDKNTDRRQ